MALITENDILEYVPDIHEYGIQDFSDMISKSENDIYRLLRIRWGPDVASKIYDNTLSDTSRYGEMDTNKLNPAELKRSTVYHVLAYYILPQLTKHEVDGDRFTNMIDFYKARFDEEFDLMIRELHYDFDSDGVFENKERVHREQLKLVR